MRSREFWTREYCTARFAGRTEEEAAKWADEAFQDSVKYKEEAEAILLKRRDQEGDLS